MKQGWWVAALNPQSLERESVAGAIKTDFILSAEIMVIALAAVPDTGILMQAPYSHWSELGSLSRVYGAVALIVKADDLGMALTKRDGGSMADGLCRAVGRVLVLGMPGFLTLLGAVGTAAMIWVGGGMILHGVEVYGAHSIGHTIGAAAETTSRVLPFAPRAVTWTVVTVLSGILGLLIGVVLIPLVGLTAAFSGRLRAFYTSVRGRSRGLRITNSG
jgi:predicted DNA repair protein MutK